MVLNTQQVVGYSPKCFVSLSAVVSECGFIEFFCEIGVKHCVITWRQSSLSLSLMGNNSLVPCF